MATEIKCSFDGCARVFSSVGNMRKHLFAAHKVRTKKVPKKAKKHQPSGKMPVQIHFCYNCGVPMPKEISV